MSNRTFTITFGILPLRPLPLRSDSFKFFHSKLCRLQCGLNFLNCERPTVTNTELDFGTLHYARYETRLPGFLYNYQKALLSQQQVSGHWKRACLLS